MNDAPTGRRVVLTDYADHPLDAIDDHLELVEQPPPSPADLGARDVIVAVESAAVGWVDLLMTSGLYQHALTPPYTPGLEYAGTVVWAGEDVEALRVGDAVLSDGFLTGPRSSGDYQRYGGFASYAVAPAEALRPLPGALSFDQGCNLLGNYETAYYCLVQRGELQPGESVLVHGASGAVGLAAVHVAKAVGARVLATSRSADKLATLTDEEGVDHGIRTTDDEGAPRRFRDEVRELTEGRGVDVVYDGVGGAISHQSLRCVRFGARYLIVGWAATPFVARGDDGAPDPNTLPTNLIMMKGLDVLGCPTVIATQHEPALREERTRQLLEWVERGRLAPRVDRRFGIEEFREAMRAKWHSRAVGGCVLRPGGAA